VFVALPDPTTPLVTALSLLPPFAPILMSVRMATSDVALWQIGLAVLLSVASIFGLTRLASEPRTGTGLPCAEASCGRHRRPRLL
jgi:ABC-type Na+ efflux pump permease subunit